jgi:hypothetical protein
MLIQPLVHFLSVIYIHKDESAKNQIDWMWAPHFAADHEKCRHAGLKL